MPNPTPTQIERNAIEDNIIKDIRNLFRLKKKKRQCDSRQNNQRHKNPI